MGGVRLNVADPVALATAYPDLAARFGPRVTVSAMAAPGPELILGMARDPALGPLIVVGAGGVLAEYLTERAVALPPLTTADAAPDLRPARGRDPGRGPRSAAVQRRRRDLRPRLLLGSAR